MRVLVITSYDDASAMMGQASELVEMPDGKTEDEVFLAFLRHDQNEPNLTWKDVEDNDHYLYNWYEHEVVKFEDLK